MGASLNPLSPPCYTFGMKLMIFIGLTLGGGVGSWIGALLSHNNYFSATSILLGAVGSLAGIWLGYRAGQYFE